MAKKLTAKAIENSKPGPQRREISDGGSGLYLIVQPSGARSWALRYRYNGRAAKLTLGPWPMLGLADARKAAADAQFELVRGVDPNAARKAAKVEAAEAAANTVASICAEFLQREGRRLRTLDQRERLLKRLVYPTIGDRPVSSVSAARSCACSIASKTAAVRAWPTWPWRRCGGSFIG